MSTFNNHFDDLAGLERMTYARFAANYMVRRPAQAPKKFDIWNELQLPNSSILHSLNGLEYLNGNGDGLPDPNLPLVVNEKAPVYIKINSQPASEDSRPFGVKESYTYRPNVIAAGISHFYQEHRKYHRIISDRMIGSMPSALVWIDYSPLNEIKIAGTLAIYRKFDIIFRTMLDKIVSIGPDVHHYIHLPQTQATFARVALQRTFKDLSSGTLSALSHDPSIFPVLHVLGFVFGRTKHLNVTPYKEDVKLLGKDDPVFNDVNTTSLLERIDPSLYGSINFIFQHDNRAVIYNLADLANFAEDTSFYQKLYRHLMSLRLSNDKIPDHIDPDSDQFDDMIADKTADKPENAVVDDSSTVSATVKEKPSATVKIVKNSDPVVNPILTNHHDENDFARTKHADNFEERLRNKVEEHHAPIVLAEPKKETKRNQLLENHLNVVINGKPLGELIQPPAVDSVTPKQMDFITSTPEPSYKKSSLLAMDKVYQDHSYHHEMAKVVGSLAKHGMFINKVEENKVHTEMDRTTTYKLHLSDVNGRTHHVKYTLPDIDVNGNMKLSGVEYRLTRQIANVPICKIAPTRVNLSSYYNKVIIERVQSKRFSYEQAIAKHLLALKNNGVIKATSGAAPLPTKPVAYDYSAIGRNFTELTIGIYTIHFGANDADQTKLSPKERNDLVKAGAFSKGAYVGYGTDHSHLFWDKSGKIHRFKAGKFDHTWSSFQELLIDVLHDDGRLTNTPIEWTQANIINQTIPLVYILMYRFGIKRVLEMIRLDYRFYADKKDVELKVDDLSVTFADGVLVFNRYPIARSLIAAGLLWTDLRSFTFQSLNIPDTYANIFQQKKMTVGVLKGIRGFFDFFVDPITESVLQKMNEPITFHELLLRANVMLTDYFSKPSSSVENHRFRLYERFNGIVYNEMMRGLQTYRNNTNSKKSYSINPEAVFQKIVQDATTSITEIINPVHEVKQRANFSFTGQGGRAGQAFVLRDRIYPEDGLGVISDAVPDSGKVGITSYLSASPRIDDIHGIPKAYTPGDQLEPPNILSIGSMVMPAGTTDDGKRNSYLSIQISHYVPNHDEGETLSVRTGYDEVLPHLSSAIFASPASDDGVVESIDPVQKVLKVRYVDKPLVATRKLKVPYLDSVIDNYQQQHNSFGLLIADHDISRYPMGGIFELTKKSYGKITDRLRCESIDAIPDKDVIKKQQDLINDLTKGRVQALYYLRIAAINSHLPGEIKSYSFADTYAQNSGAYLLQKLTPNVKVGDHFKTGDILVYNPGFFVPDPMTKQVTFKHGVTANVALVEKSTNHEDACEISKEFANRLKMTPAHLRQVITKNDAIILRSVALGQHVETSDSLCIISNEYLVGSSFTVDSENLDIFEKLNRQTPQAGYTGTVQKIRLLYGCDRDKLSDSLKAILKVYEKEVRDNFKALSSDIAAKPPEKPGWVEPGTKYAGLEFTTSTVVLEYMIDEELPLEAGDKICLMNSSKSVVSYVNDKPHTTESGDPVDVLFSTTGIINRIVSSPITVGITERVMTELKKQVVEKYFK